MREKHCIESKSLILFQPFNLKKKMKTNEMENNQMQILDTNKCGKDTVAAICRIHLIWFIIVIGYENAMHTVQWFFKR